MKVQRWLAVLVLSLMGFLPVAHAFTENASVAPTVPACCRAQGKHKCSMHDSQASAEQALYALCPAYQNLPVVSSPALDRWAFLPQRAGTALAVLAGDLSGSLQAEALYRISFARSRQKRGPPSFLS